MRIFFVSSRFDSSSFVARNFEQARRLFPSVERIEATSSIRTTYLELASLGSGLFVWIDSDNYVYPEAQGILEAKVPSILMAENEYGLVYGHGGIKLCSPRCHIPEYALDVSYFLGLEPLNIVGSLHQLGEGWVKIRAIFAEMVKLALRGQGGLLDQWKKKCPELWQVVEGYLLYSNIEIIYELLLSREKFKVEYENRMHSALQK